MHHPQRQNVTTSLVELKNGHILTYLTKYGEPQRHSWEHRRRSMTQQGSMRFDSWVSCSQGITRPTKQCTPATRLCNCCILTLS